MRFLLSFLLATLSTTVHSTPSTPTCKSGFTKVNDKCWKLVDTPVNHINASRGCMDYGATLVTAKNAIDNRAIASFLSTSSSHLVWLGLYCMDSSFSKCYWDDSTGSTADYNSFSPGFPEVDIGQCVYYSAQGALAGKWINGDCQNEQNAYICELPTTYDDTCDYNYGGNCYTLHTPLTLADAQQTCESECGTLASIHSALENRYLTTILKRVTGSLLIGANYSAPNVFKWQDGSAWNYDNVESEYLTTGNCLAISNGMSNDVPSGTWYSTSCDKAHSYVCKRPAGTQCTTTVQPVTESPSINNPSGCNGTLQMAPGVITSENYGWQSRYGETCIYDLATLGSYTILLKVTELHFPYSDNDSLAIYDTNGKQLAKLDDRSEIPFTVKSTGNTMRVVFQTDNYSNEYRRDFKAVFTSYKE